MAQFILKITFCLILKNSEENNIAVEARLEHLSISHFRQQ